MCGYRASRGSQKVFGEKEDGSRECQHLKPSTLIRSEHTTVTTEAWPFLGWNRSFLGFFCFLLWLRAGSHSNSYNSNSRRHNAGSLNFFAHASAVLSFSATFKTVSIVAAAVCKSKFPHAHLRARSCPWMTLERRSGEALAISEHEHLQRHSWSAAYKMSGPGIAALAPERTETRRGFVESTKIRPVLLLLL